MELRGWDQKRLAREMGVSRSAVNAWMNDRSYPRNAIARLEVVLGVSLGEAAADDRPAVARDNWGDEAVRTLWGLAVISARAREGMIRTYLAALDEARDQTASDPGSRNTSHLGDDEAHAS